jgi:hypothetical protein
VLDIYLGLMEAVKFTSDLRNRRMPYHSDESEGNQVMWLPTTSELVQKSHAKANS